LDEWAVEWSRWVYSQTTCESPVDDDDGSLCGLYQDAESPVFFLGTGPVGTKWERCRIPYGKAIVVPIAAFSNDNAGVDPPQSEAEIQQLVVDVKASMRDLALSADGSDMPALDQQSVGPVEFDYTLPAAPNWYSCRAMPDVGAMVVEPSYLAGYFALFPPPPPGPHTLAFGGVMTLGAQNISFGVTTSFIVEEEHE
jgi:hypothetical protein